MAPNLLSDIQVRKGNARLSPETKLTNIGSHHSLKASPVKSAPDSPDPIQRGRTNAYVAESSFTSADGLESPSLEEPLLLNSDNSSSFELPRFGRWYAQRNTSPTRYKFLARLRRYNIKIWFICSVLGLGFILFFVYLRRTFVRNCWAWKGRVGGGPCTQFTNPGDDDGIWWDRKKKDGPDKGGRAPVAVPDFALEYGTFGA